MEKILRLEAECYVKYSRKDIIYCGLNQRQEYLINMTCVKNVRLDLRMKLGRNKNQ